MLLKNAVQKIHVYAYDSTTGAAKTGDAANITGYVSLDGTANAIDDTNPAEVDSTNMPGVYVFDLTAAETNCDSFALYAKSATSNIRIEPIIGFTTAGTSAAVAATVPDTQKVDVNTIKTQAVTCAAGVTVYAYVGTAAANTAQTGDAYAVVSHADYGNAKLVRSTTPANTLSVDVSHLVAVPATQKVDVETIKTQAITCSAGVTVGVYVGGSGAAALASEVTAARMGALTDWIDGGRLDLLLDGVKTKTDGLNFTGTDVKATLDGEEVTPTAASKTGYTLTATTGLGNQTANITGNLSGSVGSVTGAVGSVTAGVTLANGAHGGAAASITLADYSAFKATGFSTHSAADVASLILATPANKLATDASGYVTFSNSSIAVSGTVQISATTGWGGSALPTVGTSTLTAQQVWEYATRTLSSFAFTVAATGDWVTDSDIATLAAYGDVHWSTATGFSTHSAADVVTALGTGSTLTAIGDTRLGYLDAAISTRQATVANLANVVTMAAQFATMIVLDGAVYDFTAAALAAGPSGTGLDAAGVRAAIGMSTADLDTQLDTILASAGSSGSGLYSGTVTVTISGSPVEGVAVHAYDGAGTLLATGTTDASGQVAMALDGTVSFSAGKVGYLTATASKTIGAAAWAQAITLTAPTITPSDPGLCTLWGVCRDEDAALESGVSVTCTHVSPPSGDTGTVASVDGDTVLSGTDGVFQFPGRLQGWTYRITRGASSKTVVVGTSTTQAVGSFVG